MKDSHALPAGKPTSALLPSQTSRTPRILVVHDDGDIRQLSTDALMGSGYKVDTAADGAAAWRALNTDNYDLLITDYEMPKVSGVELLKKLHAVRRALPVIVASADHPRKEFTRNPWLKPAVTLLMPYTVEELLVTVREVLRETNRALEPDWSSPNWKGQPSADGWQL